ncbi:GDSL esterase/lipase [Dorcoceras hygrometricum]|uniref:GDSL esterase/lipase n=1 Tax=Dorcoceras hygrometricum TaxID=472368 RepID=A0A2Z7BWH5_9LAMI|nr:GDSL esterase/lipase [Dorcoceras hygrometricum]
MVAEENKSAWADSDSEESSSRTSSSSEGEDEVLCLVADDTEEVFDFSSWEFTRPAPAVRHAPPLTHGPNIPTVTHIIGALCDAILQGNKVASWLTAIAFGLVRAWVRTVLGWVTFWEVLVRQAADVVPLDLVGHVGYKSVMLDLIGRLAPTSFTRKPALQTIGAGRSSIRSTIGIKTPSSACTRRPDEFSTDGNTSAPGPEQVRRRGGGGGAWWRPAAA